ncbi:hypothetical protein [Streptomyces sp. NBC_00576]|uniref:hypothetical protein n=1 Tax=Streptomyces sp. NBC_00576 TaxID=2903665 RepID=UPI002E819EDD|nr:hypothetical protein [Streptomyces sp. NBC_00576]WUB68905.1 hypothetical protein OG734_01710 [Streptomyces sp. NBC_00576]
MPEKLTPARRRRCGAAQRAVGVDRERVVQLAVGVLRRGARSARAGAAADTEKRCSRRRGSQVANSLRPARAPIDIDTVGLLLTTVGDWRAQ